MKYFKHKNVNIDSLMVTDNKMLRYTMPRNGASGKIKSWDRPLLKNEWIEITEDEYLVELL